MYWCGDTELILPRLEYALQSMLCILSLAACDSCAHLPDDSPMFICYVMINRLMRESSGRARFSIRHQLYYTLCLYPDDPPCLPFPLPHPSQYLPLSQQLALLTNTASLQEASLEQKPSLAILARGTLAFSTSVSVNAVLILARFSHEMYTMPEPQNTPQPHTLPLCTYRHTVAGRPWSNFGVPGRFEIALVTI